MNYNIMKTAKQVNKAAMKFSVCDEARKVQRSRLYKKLKSMLKNLNSQCYVANPLHHKYVQIKDVLDHCG